MSPDPGTGEAATVQPDAVTDEYFIWIKACSYLRLTNQIKAAAAVAEANRRRVLLVLREECVIDAALSDFIALSQLIDVRRRP
jgi:hypothetical protein